jgi:dipeptidase E
MHRLVFYSDQIIPANQAVDHALLELLDKPGARVGYIASSSDPERRYFLPKQQYYQRYSLDLCLYVELDDAFDATLLDPLFASDAIHLSGGNTFYFLYWLQQRDLLARLRDYAAQGGVLIGVSAGAILFTPSIDSALLCGDTAYAPLVDHAGLGLAPFGFVPHLAETQTEFRIQDAEFRSAGASQRVQYDAKERNHRDRSYNEQDEALQRYAQTHQRLVYGCHDGDGIVVCGEQIRLIGNVRVFCP